MAGAEYEVNISLNTKTIDAQLKALETRLSKISKVADPLTSNNEARARLHNLDRIRATGLIINRLGRELNKLEDQGVKVGKERSRIKRALKKLDEGLVESARAMNVETRDFIKQANKNLAIKEKAKKVEKETNKELVVNKRMQAENIDALANAQDKRFRLMQRINRLEEKGGKTAKLRKEMGRLTDQMSDRNFGTFKQITRTLSRQITLEESKLRTQKEQTAELDKQLARSARLGGPRSPVGGAGFIPGSPAQIAASARAGGPFSPIGGSVGIPGSPAQIAASARAGGAASPIRGSANLVGSPAYYEAQARAIARLARQGGPSDPIKGHPNLIGSPAYFDAQRKATERLARQGGAASPVRGSKDLVGSPAYFEEQQRVIDRAARQGGARSPLKGSKDLAGSPAYFEHLDREISKLARQGGAASPIRGSKNLIGSPAYYEHQRKELERLARQGGPTSPIGGTEAMPGSPAAIAARRRRIGDIALGAGFPLLFGGGPGAVLGGALGGAAGGGLAAQIGLSAAGQQIDQLIGKAIELGQALNPAAFNLERVTEAAGFAGTETQNLLQKIERYGDKAKAAELATELLRARIGDDGVKALEAFGKQAVVLGNNLSVIFTTVLANIAKAVQPLLQSLSERLGKTAAVRRFQAQDPSTLTGLDKLAFDILDPQLGTKGKSPFKLFDRDKPIQFFGTTPFEQLRNRATELGLPKDVDLRKFATERATKAAPGFEMPVLDRIEFEAGLVELPKDRSARIKRENMIAASNRRIQNLQAEAEKTKEISLIRGRIAAAEAADDKQLVERLRGEERAAEIVRKKARLIARIPKDLDAQQRLTEEIAIGKTIVAEQTANQAETERRIAKIMREEQLEAIKKQEELYKQLGDTVKDGLVDSIKAAIDDTRTLGDALASMLSRLSDQFLQLAANMAFYGNAQGTFNRKDGGIFGALISALLPLPGIGASSPIPGAAPQMTKDAVVTKTGFEGQFDGFAANGGPVKGGKSYIVGERGPELFTPGVSGGITPNHALGSTNVVVNVDASGTEVQGNQGNADQLGRLIGQAVQAELIKQKRPGGLLTR